MDSLTGFSDVDLVGQAGQGHGTAFAELLRRHIPLALRLGVRMLRDRELAEEAVQEAAIQAFTSLSRVREPASFGPWLCGIAMNLSRAFLRAKRGSALSLEELAGGVGLDALLPGSSADTEPADAAEARELQGAIQRGIVALPVGQREACLLFHIEQRNLREVADDLGISVNAVKARLHKGRVGLRERLQIEHAPTGKTGRRLERQDRRAEQPQIKGSVVQGQVDRRLEEPVMIKVRVFDVLKRPLSPEGDLEWGIRARRWS